MILLKKIKNESVVTSKVTSPFTAGPAWRAISNAIKKLSAVDAPLEKTVEIICFCKRILLSQIKNLSKIL